MANAALDCCSTPDAVTRIIKPIQCENHNTTNRVMAGFRIPCLGALHELHTGRSPPPGPESVIEGARCIRNVAFTVATAAPRAGIETVSRVAGDARIPGDTRFRDQLPDPVDYLL